LGKEGRKLFEVLVGGESLKRGKAMKFRGESVYEVSMPNLLREEKSD
jgi:hypothetical protein